MRTLQTEATEGKFLPLRGAKLPKLVPAPQEILDKIIAQMIEINDRANRK